MSFGWSLHPLTRFWELPQRQAQVTAPNSPFPAVQNVTPGTLWLLAGEPHCTHIPSACILAAVPQVFPRGEIFLVQAGMKLEVLPARAGATARQHLACLLWAAPIAPTFPMESITENKCAKHREASSLMRKGCMASAYQENIFLLYFLTLNTSFCIPLLIFFFHKKNTFFVFFF